MPTPTPGPVKKGNVNCDGAVNSVDSLMILRSVAGLPVTADCLDAAARRRLRRRQDSVDSLKILRYVAGLPVSQPQDCTPIDVAGCRPLARWRGHPTAAACHRPKRGSSCSPANALATGPSAIARPREHPQGEWHSPNL
jgi:hypothetical protein